MSQKKKRCMFPKCKIEHYSRGLCKRHYMGAYLLVKGRKTTWRRLEKLKKCLPSHFGPGRTLTDAQNWFMGNN